MNITRGDDETLDVKVTDPDTGVPVDLTGATLWFMVKRRPSDDDDDALITKTAVQGVDETNGIEVTSPEGGLFTVTIDAPDTTEMHGLYRWEVQSQDSAGAIKTLASGRLYVVADLIRTTTV